MYYYGWLHPDGTFHFVPEWGHAEHAKEECEKRGFPMKCCHNCSLVMRGYAHVEGADIYSSVPATAKQKAWIFDRCEEKEWDYETVMKDYIR